MKVSNQELKRKALTGLDYNWGKGVGAGILLYAVIMLTIMIMMFTFIFIVVFTDSPDTWISDDDLTSLIFVGIGYIFCYTVLMPFFAGTSWIYLHLIRKEQAPVSLMFTAFKYYPKLFTFGLLRMVLVFLWSLLLIVPGILKYFSYSQTIYILRDEPDLSAMEALNESKRRMQGKKGRLFLMQLSFIGWYLLGSLTTIGLLWTYPYYKATRASFYEVYIKQEDHLGTEAQSH